MFYFFRVLGLISRLSCALTKEDQGRVTLRETEAITFKETQNCFVSNTFFITVSKILTRVVHPLNSMSPAILQTRKVRYKETACRAQNPRMKSEGQGFTQSVGTKAMTLKDT